MRKVSYNYIQIYLTNTKQWDRVSPCLVKYCISKKTVLKVCKNLNLINNVQRIAIKILRKI